jgi:hypothetical protein
MSTGRIGCNPQLHQLLRERKPPLTIGDVATKIGAGRSSLVQILNGKRSGRDTWKLLYKFFTAAEYECAKSFAEAKADNRRSFTPEGGVAPRKESMESSVLTACHSRHGEA